LQILALASSATTEFQPTLVAIASRQSIRTFVYSLVVHSGLRNWRSAHWLRSSAASIIANVFVAEAAQAQPVQSSCNTQLEPAKMATCPEFRRPR
jgi:hypothetical protein